MNYHIIEEPIYQSKVLLMWACTEPEAMAFFQKRYKQEGYPGESLVRDVCLSEQDAPLEAHQMQNVNLVDVACCYTPNQGFFFGIWIAPQSQDDDFARAAMIAHECDHIATALLCNIGIHHTIGDDEPHAYYLQFLVRSVLRALQN